MVDLKRWRTLAFAFLLGAAVGGAFNTHAAESIPWFLQWLLVPGFILLVPIYAVTGGVHGSFMGVIIWLVAPANGVAYVLIAILFRRIKRTINEKIAKTN
jgi:hypothetical protein